MKRKLLKLSALTILLAFVLAGKILVHAAEPDAKTDEKKSSVKIERNAAGEVVLTLNEETQKLIALKIESVAAATHSPEVSGFGSVLDFAPLIVLHGDLAAAEAAVVAAKKIAERAKSLFEQGENVSRKSMEAAEADLRANEIKLQTARMQLEAGWGNAIAKLDSNARQKFIDDLMGHRTALVRVDLSAGETISESPKSARVQRLAEEKFLPATVFSIAPNVDPKTQGQGFILKIDSPSLSLRPGAAVKALLEISGEPRKGVLIPRDAVIRMEGKTWIYVAEAENKFTRREVKLEIPTDKGWFATTGVKADEKIVIEGGQTLLSEEQKSQIKAD